jgi:hypothetical protein
MASSKESMRQIPPCSIDLRISSPTCSISGKPPFSTVTTYTCNTVKPIWILISLFSDFADRVIVRDPNHPRGKDREGNDRRRGCYPSMQNEEFDKEELEFEDSKLVRLEPGETIETTYTLFVETGPNVVRRSDAHFMKRGNEYWIELGDRKCWWIYADEMNEHLTETEMREVLGQRQSVKWKPDCKADFTAVAQCITIVHLLPWSTLHFDLLGCIQC